MEKKDSGQLMEKIFSRLYNLIIPSSLDENEPSTKFLSLMVPGITIDSSMDPNTFKGKSTLYELVDRIPRVSKNYVDSGRKVTMEYEKVLGAITPEDDPNSEKLRAEYEKAQSLLFVDGEYTKEYQKYLEMQDAFMKAQNEYLTESNKANPDETLMQDLKNKMDVTMRNWTASGRAKIDQALATMTRYRAFTPSSIFSDAIYSYEASKTAAGSIVQFTPATWSTAPQNLSWETVTIHEKETDDHTHKDVSSVSSSFTAGFSAGLWGGSASGQYKKDLEKVQSQSKIEEFGMQFKVARVDLLRSWFNGGLLTYPNVYINGVKEKGICTGTLGGTENCSFPLMPTALILAKEINVYNNFSAEEKDYVKKSTDWSAHAQVHYGPFSLSNDTHCSDISEDEKKEGFSASGKITIGEKPQIIGIISTVMSPAFPQAAAPSFKANLNAGGNQAKPHQTGTEVKKSEVLVTQALNRHMGY